MSEHVNLARGGDRSEMYSASTAVWARSESDVHVRLVVGRDTERDGIRKFQVMDGKLEEDTLIDPEGLVFFMFQNIDQIRDARIEFGLVEGNSSPDIANPHDIFEVDSQEVLRNLHRPYAS